MLGAGSVLPTRTSGNRHKAYYNKEAVDLRRSLGGLKTLRHLMMTGDPDEEGPWTRTYAEVGSAELASDTDYTMWRTEILDRESQHILMKEMITGRRRLLNEGEKRMKREAAQQFIAARRAKVDIGAKGIVQQIMGKFRTHAEMIALTALHPDTVYVRYI